MSAYIPVVTGEVDSLREGVEGLLTQTPETLGEQIASLDRYVRGKGKVATFGAELEFQFIDDPNAEQIHDFDGDKEDLCTEVIREAHGGLPTVTWRKGEVVHPDHSPGVIYDSYQIAEFSGSDVVEIRTAPAGALEAIERYWTTVQAIGTVARRYGYLGLIQSTHINAAVWQEPDSRSISEQPGFAHFVDPRNHALLAAVQQNLVAANPLQIDAGLEPGFAVLEAYPRRDASTNIYSHRLEFRHPTVGIVDPRIDMVAVLDGLKQAIDGSVPPEIVQRVHSCRTVRTINNGNNSALEYVLRDLALWDNVTQEFVLPATLDYAASYEVLEEKINDVTRFLADNIQVSDTTQNGSILRDAIGGLGLNGHKLSVHPNHPHAAKLNMFAHFIEKVELVDDRVRVTPDIAPDTPEIHADRRRYIARSPIVRRMFGGAATKLTPAAESIKARQDLVDRQMVILP